MFNHIKTNQPYYSVREKINYYKRVIDGKEPNASPTARRIAKGRLRTLQRLDSRSFDEPELIMTNDKHFGNESKPRIAAVVDKDSKWRLLVIGSHKRKTDALVLDKQPDRQLSGRKVWIDRSEVYETRDVNGVKKLSRYDKTKIKAMFCKKNSND